MCGRRDWPYARGHRTLTAFVRSHLRTLAERARRSRGCTRGPEPVQTSERAPYGRACLQPSGFRVPTSPFEGGGGGCHERSFIGVESRSRKVARIWGTAAGDPGYRSLSRGVRPRIRAEVG